MKKKYKTNDPYELADLSWGFIIFLWFCWWPLGAGLTVGKLIHQQKRQQANRYIPSSPYNYRPTADSRQHRDYEGTLRAEANAQPQQPRPHTDTDTPSPEQSKAAQKRGWLTPFFLVMGVFLALGGLSVFLEGLDTLRRSGDLLWSLTDSIIPGLLMGAGGGAMFRTGLHNRKLAKQEALLDTIVGPRANVTLDELSAASGLGKKETLKVVQSAIAHGRFGADAYVDMATRTLVVRGAAPAAPAKAPAAAKKSTAKQPKEDKYQAILRQLRQANEAIPGQAMSAKIDRMELVSARIFELAKQDPNKESQLSRFMDYYLPTALKLLNTYAELDRPGLTGENINETKLGIEQAMDLLVTAFENQLDKLYESDALDVSSEISALQGMLNLDGLTPSADFDTAPRGGTGR